LRKANRYGPALRSFRKRGVHECESLRRMRDVQTREQADELVTSVADDAVVGAQRCPQGVGDFAQHAVTGSMTARVVDRLEVVDVDERKRERLLCPRRSSDLAFQFRESGAPQVHTGEIVHGRLLALGRRRAAIGKRGVPVSLGLTAFGSPRSAIGERCRTVDFGFTAFAGSCPPILRGSISVEGGFAPIQRPNLGLRGDFIPLVSGSIALVSRLISPLGDIVPAVRGSVTLITRVVTALGHVVAAVARLIAVVTRPIAQLGGIVPRVAAAEVLHNAVVPPRRSQNRLRYKVPASEGREAACTIRLMRSGVLG